MSSIYCCASSLFLEAVADYPKELAQEPYLADQQNAQQEFRIVRGSTRVAVAGLGLGEIGNLHLR
jgi:hypothetical protein